MADEAPFEHHEAASLVARRLNISIEDAYARLNAALEAGELQRDAISFDHRMAQDKADTKLRREFARAQRRFESAGDDPALEMLGEAVEESALAVQILLALPIQGGSLLAWLDRQTATQPAQDVRQQRPRRGPKASVSSRVKLSMEQDLAAGKVTPEALRIMSEKTLAIRYGASRDTVRHARKDVLSKLVEPRVETVETPPSPIKSRSKPLKK
jgi:hypothetical protein